MGGIGEAPPKVRFASDSPLEGDGFEPSVPPERKAFPKALDDPPASLAHREAGA
jgi:hypothetical protein